MNRNFCLQNIFSKGWFKMARSLVWGNHIWCLVIISFICWWQCSRGDGSNVYGLSIVICLVLWSRPYLWSWLICSMRSNGAKESDISLSMRCCGCILFPQQFLSLSRESARIVRSTFGLCNPLPCIVGQGFAWRSSIISLLFYKK